MLTPHTVRRTVAGAGKGNAPGSAMSRMRQVQVRRLIQGDDSDSGGEEPRRRAVDRGAAAASLSATHGHEAWQIACETAEQVVRGAGPRIKPPAPSTPPQHDAPLSPSASPASVTPMALSVLHEWGSGLTAPHSSAGAGAQTAASESTALSAHATTASGVKQWLRANDAFEPASRPKPRGAGLPQCSVGALLLQDTWGRFYVGALLPARLALPTIIDDACCMLSRMCLCIACRCKFALALCAPRETGACAALRPGAVQFALVTSLSAWIP